MRPLYLELEISSEPDLRINACCTDEQDLCADCEEIMERTYGVDYRVDREIDAWAARECAGGEK